MPFIYTFQYIYSIMKPQNYRARWSRSSIASKEIKHSFCYLSISLSYFCTVIFSSLVYHTSIATLPPGCFLLTLIHFYIGHGFQKAPLMWQDESVNTLPFDSVGHCFGEVLQRQNTSVSNWCQCWLVNWNTHNVFKL